MQSVRQLFSPSGPVAAVLPGFSARRDQLAMAEAVAETLEDFGELVVEAGTGIGKTFAYLVPALFSGRRVIVSTATRTLQDQIFHRDLPLLGQALGRPVACALLKGRANYLCRHRLAVARTTPELSGFERSKQKYLARIEAWSRTTVDGDIGELASVPEQDPVWGLVTSTRENCLGRACREFADCHVVRARAQAQAAELVIVNHHLLLADMALREEGFAELLPGADAVIVDEAHQFPDVAVQFFGTRIAERAVRALARDVLSELASAGLLDAAGRALAGRLEQAIAALTGELRGLTERIAWSALPDAALEAVGHLDETLTAMAVALETPEFAAPGLRQCARRAGEAAERLQSIRSADDSTGFRWAETGERWRLEFTPFEIADRLRALSGSRRCAWIYTSATLAVGDHFEHFTRRVGAEAARTLLLPSPFDYESRARLYLPPRLPEPSDPNFTAAVIDAALPLIRAAGGRSFVLFTSRAALADGARYLKRSLTDEDGFPVLVQGEAPRDVLLRRFRDLGNAVLLGTGSFWEGVDVRGPALSLVVIDKLPFASPDDPLLKARLEGFRRDGRDGFREHQLPQAVLSLKQGVGRLIRDPQDFGVVMIGDPRLLTRGYGRAFLASLPPMTVTREAAEAIGFLHRHLGEPAPASAP